MLYDTLLGLEMIMDVNILKYDDQCPKSIHVLEIFIILLRYAKFLIIALRYLQDNLSSPKVKSLLYLLMDNMNSFLEKGGYSVVVLSGISFNNKILTCQY